MLPPLPRCSRRAYSSLSFAHPYQPSPEGLPGRPAHRPFRRLLSVHSRCGLHTRAGHQFVTRYPKASDISSPPCLLRLLPAGAVAGWGFLPLESAALSRRTPIADFYSITSVPRASSIGGTTRSIAVAVFKLIMSSNVVG